MTTLSSSPQILFFDAAGTLFHLPRGVGEHYREVALRHGLDLSVDDLDRAFRAAWRAVPRPPTTRAQRVDDDKEWWRSLVYEVLHLCAGEIAGVRDALFEELYTKFTKPGIWELYPEVREVLAGLRSRFRLGVISNFDGRLRPILADLGILHLFELIVISSEVGADKPDPWIFTHAAELAGVQPNEALHIGDDAVCDWEGARAAGMVSFELDRPRNCLKELVAILPGTLQSQADS